MGAPPAVFAIEFALGVQDRHETQETLYVVHREKYFATTASLVVECEVAGQRHPDQIATEGNLILYSGVSYLQPILIRYKNPPLDQPHLCMSYSRPEEQQQQEQQAASAKGSMQARGQRAQAEHTDVDEQVPFACRLAGSSSSTAASDTLHACRTTKRTMKQTSTMLPLPWKSRCAAVGLFTGPAQQQGASKARAEEDGHPRQQHAPTQPRGTALSRSCCFLSAWVWPCSKRGRHRFVRAPSAQ